MGIACLGVVAVLYVGVWLGMYRGFKAWSAGRGVQLNGGSARLATWSLMTLVSLPLGFTVGWICQVLMPR
jgi:hypothetical protein